MKIKLGFSTCPNDTFMFDAMVHGRIDLEGIEFEVVMADIFHLNQIACLDIYRTHPFFELALDNVHFFDGFNNLVIELTG